MKLQVQAQTYLGEFRLSWPWLLLYNVISLSSAWSHFMQEQVRETLDLQSLSESYYEPLHRENREAKACQPVLYENTMHTKHAAATLQIPQHVVDTHYFLAEVGENYWEKRRISVLHQVVNNPQTTVSILEPGQPGSCKNGTDGRTLVRETARNNDCIVAVNAGMFNTHSGACLGNIVSDGVLVQDSGGIQNAHFGLTQAGQIFMGYLSEMDLLTEDFTQLVGGVMWLVKDGASYVEESLKYECPDTQETGTLERFTTVVSARTAIGHDAEGRVHLVEVNGKTDQMGVNLYELAEILIKLGMVNAINLDGGGSGTAVINGTLVNYPSDQCVNSSYNCERPVTTIVCVHAPYCQPRDCSGHGSCDMGVCHCHGYWHGPHCSKLKCPDDCSWHGTCTEAGCRCKPGWRGQNCSLPCQFGFYGENCSAPCFCQNGASCDAVTGKCICKPGFSGSHCQLACPMGFYGEGCSEVCFCEDSCFCDPISGNCTTTPSQLHSQLIKAGECLASVEMKRQNLVPSTEDQSGLWLTTVLCLSTLGVSSLLLNALLSLTILRLRRRHQVELKQTCGLAVKHALRYAARSHARHNSENDDEDDGDDDQGDDSVFIEEPLNSSSDAGQQPQWEANQLFGKSTFVKTEPHRPKKSFGYSYFFALKSLRWKRGRSPAKTASLFNLPVREPRSEQLFPLLSPQKNGIGGVHKEEYTSSDQDVESLFIAPQRTNKSVVGSR